MMYLVDTNVISELRKAHKAEPRVVEWARNREPQCMYLSVISVLEIRMGILSVQRRDECLPMAFTNSLLVPQYFAGMVYKKGYSRLLWKNIERGHGCCHALRGIACPRSSFRSRCAYCCNCAYPQNVCCDQKL